MVLGDQRLYSNAEVSRLLSTGGGILSGQDVLENELSRFLVQAVIIIGICRGIGFVASFLKQPQVIFEIIGGIILGPSAIGKNTKYLSRIFPKTSLSYLQLVADIGLILYLFLVGMELDVPKLAAHARRTGSVAIIGMAVPFALGIAISPTLFHTLQGNDPAYNDVPMHSFFVFIGTAMSITAFPVLARILKEGGLIYSKAGAMVMGAAALNDAIAWCLLILAISIANAKDMRVAGYVFGCVAAFALGMYVLFRPIFGDFVTYVETLNSSRHRSNLFALTLIICFLCSWTTALLGLDGIFGAFIFGLVIPRNSQLFRDCNEFIEHLIVTFALPLYFALSGLKTDVTKIHSGAEGSMIILVCFIATIGKFVGCGCTAWLSGLSIRESSTVAVLMNTRGLVELIVLNLGLQANILDVKTFSVMVIMCLFTTFITSPLVAIIYPPHLRGEEESPVSQEISNHSREGGEGEENKSRSIQIHRAADISLCFVIPKFDSVASFMSLLSMFTPISDQFTLCASFVKVDEPSLSAGDEVIGFNDDNHVIDIREQPISLEGFYATTSLCHSNATATKTLDLMPLTMHATTIGAQTVRSFHMKGDPASFPAELSTLTNSLGTDMIVIPYRTCDESMFTRRLFWGTLRRCTSSSVSLFVDTGSIVNLAPDVASAVAVDEVNRGRSISMSAMFPQIFSADNADKSSSTQTHRHQSFTAVPPVQGRNVRGPLFNIFAIFTGADSDVKMGPVLLRALESPSVTVTVLLFDYDSENSLYSDELQSVVSTLRLMSTSTYSNLTLLKKSFDGCVSFTDQTEKIVKEVMNHSAIDICLFSFSMPVSSAPVRYHRSNSITMTMINALSAGTFDPPINTDLPESLSNCDLVHPELGTIGDCLAKQPSSVRIPFFMIFYDPSLFFTNMLPRRRSTSAAVIMQHFEVEAANSVKTLSSNAISLQPFDDTSNDLHSA